MDDYTAVCRKRSRGIHICNSVFVWLHLPINPSKPYKSPEAEQSLFASRVILATKAHLPMYDDPNEQSSGRRRLIDQCYPSLGGYS